MFQKCLIYLKVRAWECNIIMDLGEMFSMIGGLSRWLRILSKGGFFEGGIKILDSAATRVMVCLDS
jgi:hypothetical protein